MLERFLITKQGEFYVDTVIGGFNIPATEYYAHYETPNKQWSFSQDDATSYKTYGEAMEDIDHVLPPGVYSIGKVYLKHKEADFEKS